MSFPRFVFLGLLLCLPAFASFGPSQAAAAPRKVEVVFVVDTTGSMSGLIEGAKKKIWSIANMIIDQYPNAEIKFGLVGYRDIGDAYVTKHFALTTDVQSIYAQLLQFEAEGGGDTPESVNEALDVAVTKLGWSDKRQVKADRILFLVGDAPPHMDYKQDRKYKEVIGEAVQKGIIVNTVQCGDMASTTKIWKEMAKLGKGEYLPIPQDGGRVRVIETPYDEQIIIIQRKLNVTVVPYGSRTRQSEVQSKARMYEDAPKAAALDMSSYVSKADGGKAVVTGSGDLVADFNDGKVKLDKVPETELPAELQKMSPAERETFINEKTAERDALSKELAGLVQQRDTYVRDEEKKAPAAPADSFDTGVKKTLEMQMKGE